jgi:hypothetical protein
VATTDANEDLRPLPRGLAYLFVFGGMLGFAGLVDFVRFLLHLSSPITTSWLLVIIFTGIAIGGIAFVLLSKARVRRRPTPNNRWRGP